MLQTQVEGTAQTKVRVPPDPLPPDLCPEEAHSVGEASRAPVVKQPAATFRPPRVDPQRLSSRSRTHLSSAPSTWSLCLSEFNTVTYMPDACFVMCNIADVTRFWQNHLLWDDSEFWRITWKINDASLFCFAFSKGGWMSWHIFTDLSFPSACLLFLGFFSVEMKQLWKIRKWNSWETKKGFSSLRSAKRKCILLHHIRQFEPCPHFHRQTFGSERHNVFLTVAVCLSAYQTVVFKGI